MNAQPLALPNYSALGSLVTPDLDSFAARRPLKDAGWSRLGTGATAAAYLSPHGDRVIKLVDGDQGNRATIDAALANPENPHLPRIYGLLDFDNGSFAVEMEVLEPGRERHGAWEKTWSAGRGQAVSYGLSPRILEAPDCPMKAALIALDEAAQEYGDGMIWDCHDGNLMVRPATGELVLNDLLYFDEERGYASNRATCDRCGGHFDFGDEGRHVDGDPWCYACLGKHAVYCKVAGEFFEASEDDAKVLDVWASHGGLWEPLEGAVAADSIADAYGSTLIWDEEAGLFVEAELHAVLTAIQGIAREALAQHEQPLLPFRLAA